MNIKLLYCDGYLIRKEDQHARTANAAAYYYAL